MKYLDTVVEDVDRIKKGRKNINKGITLMLIAFTVMAFVSFIIYFLGGIVTGLYFMMLSGFYLLLMIGLVIKREIYSIAIILKEKE